MVCLELIFDLLIFICQEIASRRVCIIIFLGIGVNLTSSWYSPYHFGEQIWGLLRIIRIQTHPLHKFWQIKCLRILRQNKTHCCGHKETFSVVSSFWRNITSWRELPGKTLLWNLHAAIIAETVFAKGTSTWTFWSSMNTPTKCVMFYIHFFLLLQGYWIFRSFLQHSFFRQKRVCCLWNTVIGLLRHSKNAKWCWFPPLDWGGFRAPSVVFWANIHTAARWEVVLHLQLLSCSVKSRNQSGCVKISKEPDIQSCQDGISLGILNVMDDILGKNTSTCF